MEVVRIDNSAEQLGNTLNTAMHSQEVDFRFIFVFIHIEFVSQEILWQECGSSYLKKIAGFIIFCSLLEL